MELKTTEIEPYVEVFNKNKAIIEEYGSKNIELS